MITDRGWAFAGAGLALIALWIALGEIELLAGAVLLLSAIAAAMTMVRWRRPVATVQRRLAPNLVHEGDQAAVEVAIANLGRRKITDAALRDDVGSLGSADFEIGEIGRNTTVTAGYDIVCRPRGVYDVGPARLITTDPLGLARLGRTIGESDRLVVYPEVEDLSGFPIVRGRDPAMHASRPEFSHRGGEDFFTLREYVLGDDLRRVHWPSSAKRDELMIKQLETPWQSRALVILDIRNRVYDSPDAFEKAVRGSASVVRHLAQAGFDAELWAGGSGTVSVSRYSDAMESLALVDMTDRLDIRAVAGQLSRTGKGGALFLVTGQPDSDLVGVQQLLSRDYRSVILMGVAERSSSAEVAFRRMGATTMIIRPDESWAEAWMRSTSRSWTAASPV